MTTASKITLIRVAMIPAFMAAFLLSPCYPWLKWLALGGSVMPDPNRASFPLHLLMVAYFAHLLVRTIWLSLSWKTIRDR